MRIAFAGNPNSGKTTMYNALTGRNEHVGNWAGVTVERKESPIRKGYYDGTEELVAVDLPGAYSMSPFTSEESITSGYVKNENPDVIINIVDATNLSRSLFFTTQLLELGIPVVVALNKSDIVNKKQTKIDEKILSEKLGCPVIKTISTSSGHEGLKETVNAAAALRGKGQKAPYVQADIDFKDKTAVEAADRKRFEFVNGIVKQVEKRKVFTKDKNVQDKIDSIITHKIIGIPIFAAVIFLVFYISQTTLGTWIAEWLVAWIETFQGWVGGLMENANPLPITPCRWYHRWRWRSCRFPSACYGHVFPDRTAGRLRIHCESYSSSGSDLQESRAFGKIRYSDGHRYRMCDSGCYVLPYDS